MTVKELIDILKECDQQLDIRTHSNGHTSGDYDSHGDLSVAIYNINVGKCKDEIVIGNFNSFSFSYPKHPEQFYERIQSYIKDSAK